MCGIVGKVSSTAVELRELEQMARSIAHRGPDDEGYWLDGAVGLGHRRLSIIDLSTGRQPITNEDRTLWIVFNGEIYNYPELRDELLAKGHHFVTTTDTEVILHLYEEMGEACVERLNGMFAFAIWDCRDSELFLARDRIGQKPLFYLQRGRDFLFASEVKAILAADNVDRSIDYTALHHYLSLRFIPAPHTMFEGIRKLPAGHTLRLKDERVVIQRYWDLDFTDKLRHSEAGFLDGLEEQLRRAVGSHLISDVPVGAFLSGGMDTSTVVTLMAEIERKPFKTFAIGVKEQDFNELPYARIVAEHCHTEHIDEIVSANLIDLLPVMIHHLDEPSDSIAACMFQAARLASQHVKVVMGGDGGDELFAGFDRYIGVGYINSYNKLPLLLREKVFRPLIRSLPDSFTYKSAVQKLRWIDQLSSFQGGQRYAEATAFFRFSHQQKEHLFAPELWKNLQHIDSNGVIVEQYDKPNAEDPIDRMLYADFMTRLSEHTLMLTDRMNMAFGLEARSPFLDHQLVEYLARFPSRLKIKGRQLKYILRKFAEKRLPAEITARSKQGFMFPVAYWFRNELYPFLCEQLEQSFFVQENLFRRSEIHRLIEEHRSNRVDNHVRLWMLLNVDIWHRIYIQGQAVAQVSADLRKSAGLQDN
jgi:asparagine synthase (glutamine-hydrolysing)